MKKIKSFREFNESVFDFFRRLKKEGLYKKINNIQDINQFRDLHKKDLIDNKDIKKLETIDDIIRLTKKDNFVLGFTYKNKYAVNLTKYEDEWFVLDTISVDKFLWSKKANYNYFICDTIDGVIQALQSITNRNNTDWGETHVTSRF